MLQFTFIPVQLRAGDAADQGLDFDQGSLSFGNVGQAGLSEEFVLGDLNVIGSLAGGGDLGEVDLVYVPEPTSAVLLAVGLAIGLLHFRRTNR